MKRVWRSTSVMAAVLAVLADDEVALPRPGARCPSTSAGRSRIDGMPTIRPPDRPFFLPGRRVARLEGSITPSRASSPLGRA